MTLTKKPRPVRVRVGQVVVFGGKEFLLTPQAAATCNTLARAGIASGRICLLDLQARQLVLLSLTDLRRAVEEQWGRG